MYRFIVMNYLQRFIGLGLIKEVIHGAAFQYKFFEDKFSVIFIESKQP